MEELTILLRFHDIDFDPVDRCIMCFPHVINICCQHVINEFTNFDLVDSFDLDDDIPGHVGVQSYEDAVKHDPVAHG